MGHTRGIHNQNMHTIHLYQHMKALLAHQNVGWTLFIYEDPGQGMKHIEDHRGLPPDPSSSPKNAKEPIEVEPSNSS